MTFLGTERNSANLVLCRNLFSLLAVSLLVNTCVSRGELSNFIRMDVDGDGIEEIFEYTLTHEEEAFTGQMKITRANGEVLWNHEWKMRTEDLQDLIGFEGVSLDDWRRDYLSGKLHYGAVIERRKLVESKIDPEQVKFHAELENLDPETVLEYILQQESSYLFSYRAVWREDLIQLVYVQKERRFIHYGSGGY